MLLLVCYRHNLPSIALTANAKLSLFQYLLSIKKDRRSFADSILRMFLQKTRSIDCVPRVRDIETP